MEGKGRGGQGRAEGREEEGRKGEGRRGEGSVGKGSGKGKTVNRLQARGDSCHCLLSLLARRMCKALRRNRSLMIVSCCNENLQRRFMEAFKTLAGPTLCAHCVGRGPVEERRSKRRAGGSFAAASSASPQAPDRTPGEPSTSTAPSLAPRAVKVRKKEMKNYVLPREVWKGAVRR